MIIGHLPAGFVTAQLLFERTRRRNVDRWLFVLAGMLGAVAPDIDLLYFYLIDGRQHHHHSYFTHFPVVWMAGIFVSIICMIIYRVKRWPILAAIASLAGFIHMLLDSIVGDIAWLAPFSMQRYSLFVVPAIHKVWWLNIILHWTFVLELALLFWAAILWWRTQKMW